MSSINYKREVIKQKKSMEKNNWKQVLISILVGAGVTFFATLFEGLADLLKSHSTEIVSGISATTIYLAKAYKG